MTRIPSTIDEVTPEWLTEALCSNGQLTSAKVIGCRAEPIGVGVGIMAVLHRMELDYDHDDHTGPASVVVKLPTSDPPTRGAAQAFRFYEKEVRTYRDLAVGLPVATPTSYYADWDESSGDFVLVLEDLCHLGVIDQLAGATVDQAATLLERLGDLHAAWPHERADSLDWLPALTDPPFPQALHEQCEQAGPAFLENFGSHLPSEFDGIVDRYIAYLPQSMAALSEGPLTFCHGDYRLDNFFVGADDDIIVVDWQICLKARGGYDVGYFMSQSIDPELRRVHEVDLLHRYHDRLVAQGRTDYSFDLLLDDYRKAIMQCFCYPLVAGGTIELANDRAVELVTSMLDRSVSAIQAHDALALLD